jgi:3-(3-hydroxy-phenyl)propionate hydroxylase
MPDHTVVIAGAGPAGCALALYLARQSIPVLLLEAEPYLPLDLRASTFHPPSLDMLEPLGLTARMLEIGLVTSAYQYRDRRTGESAVFDLGLLAGETAHPFRLQCEQYKMTRLACELLQEYPHAEIRFNHRVSGAENRSGFVAVTVETPHGPQQLRTEYLVGADGAASQVRKSLGIEYEGFTYPEKFLVVSTPFDFADALPGLSNVNYVSDPEEWCVVLRTPELWRVLFPTASGDSEQQLLSDEPIQQRLRRLSERPGPFEVAHRTLYNVHQRVAKTYRSGRVLLMGDAAHINNPLGGMGMNGGLHDAFNLGEKLLKVLRRQGTDELLELYDRQRRTIALEFVQQHTIRNKRLMEEREPELQKRRQSEFMRTAGDPALAKAFLLRNSMIQSLRDAAAIQ